MKNTLKILLFLFAFILTEIVLKILLPYKIFPFIYVPFIMFVSLNYKNSLGYAFSFFLGLFFGIEFPELYLKAGILFLLISFLIYFLKFHMDYKSILTKVSFSFIFSFISLVFLDNTFFTSILRSLSTVIFSILFFYVAEKTQ